MTNDTKYALEASLKKFLLKKPIDKITIRDLTDDCGISRMAFYYHFKDIYDLVEWSCFEVPPARLPGKRLTIHGRRDCCRSLKPCWRTSHSS